MNQQLSIQKRALRRQSRIGRDQFVAALGPAPWTCPDKRCFPKIAALMGSGAVLGSYRPVGNEADPAPIDAFVRATRKIISYPRVDTDGLMRFYTLGASGTFEAQPLGFEAPGMDGALAEPTVILVPLLAFDRQGTRLGQGGGHYDRAMAAAANNGRKLTKIGVAWSVQEIADLPREPWDIPLDIVITEQEWIVTS